MQKKLITILAASAFAVSAIAPAYAKPFHHHFFHHHHHHHGKFHGGGGGSQAGAWIVGSIAVAAASLITCATIVNKKYNRELTQKEAFGAAALPFSCLFTIR